MADPITISAGVAMAGTAAGGIVSGIGSAASGAAAAAASTYKAGVAMLNKQINDQNAQFATEEGQILSEERGLQGSQEVANTEVTQAASGFDVNSGTTVAVRQSQQWATQFDQSVIEWDAAKTAWGYEAKGATDVAEASLDTMAASSEKTAGILGEIGSFINAGTSVASKWYQGTSSGAFGSKGGGSFGAGSLFMGGGSPTGL